MSKRLKNLLQNTQLLKGRCRIKAMPFNSEHGNPLQYSFGEIPWTEELGGLQSVGLQRDGLDLAADPWELSDLLHIYIYK